MTTPIEKEIKFYCSVDKNMKFQFPEQNNHSVDPNKMAIAISGGGSRSAICSTGHFRALRRKNTEFYKRISYISSISGGSWFSSIFTYADVNIVELLGESIPLEYINKETLTKTNFDIDTFIGKIFNNFPVANRAIEGFFRGISPEKIWSYICGSLILEPYGLNRKTTSISKNENENNIFPRDGAPFWICTAAIMDNNNLENGALTCEFTPMYSGLSTPQLKYGGLLFENQGFGCDFKELYSLEDSIMSTKGEDFTLDMIIASSSAAFGADIPNINLKTKIWGFVSNKDHDVDLIDGGFADFTGITSLVARGCKKILSFVNCSKFDNDYNNIGISHLFEPGDNPWYTYGKDLEIFSKDSWYLLKSGFEKRIEENKTVYFYGKIPVLSNWKAGVNGGYEVELLIIPLFEHPDFQIPIDVNSCEFQELNKFPNINYIFALEDKILELSESQINLLSTYTDWYLTKVMDELPCFFEELK